MAYNDFSKYIDKICQTLPEYAHIDAEDYVRYGVKRGLRNADGTGVMAGVTKIGDVHGYELVNGQRVPVDGKLYYRGYDVERLIEGFTADNRYGFEETAYLILFGKLPTKDDLEHFTSLLNDCRELPRYFTEDMIIKAPSRNIMNKLARSVLAMYSYDDNPDDLSPENIVRQCLELIARFPIIVAHAYQVKRHEYDNKSMHIHNPKTSLNSAQNLLRLLRSDKAFTEEEAHLIDISLVLHAEHGGGNNSAFTCRTLSSSGTDTYAAISAAVGSLKGFRHGGANLKVLEMVDHFKAVASNPYDEGELKDFLYKVLKKEAGDGSGLIYGMGHAIYTLSDPRAKILRNHAEKLAEQKDMLDEFNIYRSIERLTPEIIASVKGDEKPMCANVDLYSGFVYQMLGIPSEVYTPIFAISRIVGWSAHRMEEVLTQNRIIRPAYKSLFEEHEYVPLSDR
ncbi:MAG: citrate/2-methylcitrate synthase [Clostridia bacterium]|nr:citrate/2-methylcitrate synthase [Clostridia bacterium]